MTVNLKKITTTANSIFEITLSYFSTAYYRYEFYFWNEIKNGEAFKTGSFFDERQISLKLINGDLFFILKINDIFFASKKKLKKKESKNLFLFLNLFLKFFK